MHQETIGTAAPADQQSAERIARFTGLYERHYDRLLRYAWRRVGESRAEDLVHEVFTVAWRRLDDVPTTDGIAWLYKVAHNVLLNSERLDRRDAHPTAAAVPLWEPDHAEAVSQRHVALTALSNLNADDRHLVQLVAWDGLDAQQISDLLGCSRASIYLRLHRLRKKLVRLLDPPFQRKENDE